MAQYFEAVGRRKESIARVRLMDGSGNFTVNENEIAGLVGPNGSGKSMGNVSIPN